MTISNYDPWYIKSYIHIFVKIIRCWKNEAADGGGNQGAAACQPRNDGWYELGQKTPTGRNYIIFSASLSLYFIQ